jgi:arylsulfatase A-like enzyme
VIEAVEHTNQLDDTCLIFTSDNGFHLGLHRIMVIKGTPYVELHGQAPEARRGFVLLQRRWVVERDFEWAMRFRRLVKAYQRPPKTVAGLHFVTCGCLFLHRTISIIGPSP